MKNYMVAALVVVSLVVVAESKRCRTDRNCSKDECCVINIMGSGSCKRRAGKGQFCESYPRFGGVHIFRCPCREGLKCASDKHESRFGDFHFQATCVGQTTSTEEPTSTTVLPTTESSTVNEVVTEEATTLIVTDEDADQTTRDEGSLETVSSESD